MNQELREPLRLLAMVEKENALLRAALEFYADVTNYDGTHLAFENDQPLPAIASDRGGVARRVLQKVGHA